MPSTSLRMPSPSTQVVPVEKTAVLVPETKPRLADTVLPAAVAAAVEGAVAFSLTAITSISIGLALTAAAPVALSSALGFWWAGHRRQSTVAAAGSQGGPEGTVHVAGSLPEAASELLHVIAEVGIVAATGELSDSKYEPTQCMASARHSLWFMGVLGSKWVVVPHVRAEFEQFLRRIEARGGTVRFLLTNPNGVEFDKLKSLREGAISVESLDHFARLQERFKCLKVRLYDELPCFRLVFLDQQTVAVARYRVDREGYFQSKFGWDAPHVAITANAPWSFYEPFERYFEQIWESAVEYGSD